jgi:hypothetical protein
MPRVYDDYSFPETPQERNAHDKNVLGVKVTGSMRKTA